MTRLMSRHLRTICGVALTLVATWHVAVLGAQSTPTAAMKAYYEAAKQKDYAALKGLLSTAYLKELGKSPFPLERTLQAMTERVPPTMPEVRNEKMTGDRATLEVRNHESKQWETMVFVRENGIWKLGLPETPK